MLNSSRLYSARRHAIPGDDDDDDDDDGGAGGAIGNPNGANGNVLINTS